jgi:hypothetical protein
MREYDASSHIGRELLIHIATEGKCPQCGHWVPIKSKINSQMSGTVLLFSHRQKYAAGPCAAGLTTEIRRGPVHVPPSASAFDRAQVEASTSEGQCSVCLAWVELEPKLPPVDPAAPWIIQEHMHRVSKRAKCVGRLAVDTRLKYTNGPATMAATPTKEDTRVDTQTQELRLRLRNARAERELKIKTDNADAIVTRLDSLPAGSIVRFVKPYAATGGKPSGEYTYVAIKPVDGARWYTTGCDANPMNSDDLASFMVGAESVTSWDVLGDVSETFQVPDVAASDTPAQTATDAWQPLPSAAEILDAGK